VELRGLVFGGIRNGRIPLLKPNESYEINIFFFGLGKGKIKVTAGNSFKTANLVMPGPFSFIRYNFMPNFLNYFPISIS